MIGENISKIGGRLEYLRKDNHYSVESIENILNVDYGVKCSRQFYRKCEIGEKSIPLDVLLALSKLYKCDVAYILGEIPERTYTNREICNSLGLTEKSVEKIMLISKQHNQLTDILSLIIENQQIIPLLNHINNLKNPSLLNNTFISSTLNNLLGNGIVNNPNMSGTIAGGVIKQYETPEQLREVYEFQTEKIFLSILSDIEKA